MNREKYQAILAKMTLKQKVSLLSGRDHWSTVSIRELGLGSAGVTDGPNGARTDANHPERFYSPATSFPTGTAMGSSWDPDLVRRVGGALAAETLAVGSHVLLGPTINIIRTPLAGRNFETFSEDPFLTGRIGIAFVKGVQAGGAGTSLKHFACNNQEHERFRGSSEVDERTLREIYLPAFEAVVRAADPWTVMCAYNRINGVYASQNHYLLNGILKKEWKYRGVVMSDWYAVHTIFESVAAGLDLEMPGPPKFRGKLLEEAVYNWQIGEKDIDRAVLRLLRLADRCGKLGKRRTARKGAINTPAHQVLARKTAEASIVLLKNEGGLLPLDLKKRGTLAVIGPNAAVLTIGGGGSAFVDTPYTVSPLQGLRKLTGKNTRLLFEEGCDNFEGVPPLAVEWTRLPDGNRTGFRAEYFGNKAFAGRPAARALVEKMNLWNFQPPGGVPRDRFSCRFVSDVTVPKTGRYGVRVENSGQTQVYINRKRVLQNGNPSNRSEIACGTRFRTLTAGKKYRVEVRFFKTPDMHMSYVQLLLGYMPQAKDDDRIERAIRAAKKADAVLVFAGMPLNFEKEAKDRPHMDLPGRQNELIGRVTEANSSTAVILNAGAPVTMPWVDKVKAVLFAFYPGLEGGNAIARVISGAVCPSGKLSFTLPRQYGDNPTYGNYPGGKKVHYGEGVFVGYRHYDARNVEPLFPFGHGLSYAGFAYSGLKTPARVVPGKPVIVSLKVKNRGRCAAKEVVQIYVSHINPPVPRPVRELCAFKKVNIAAGKSVTVRLSLAPRAFSFYDPDRPGWRTEPGVYEISAGSSSRDMRLRKRVRVG